MPLNPSRFVRACLRQPVDRTPVWFLRQAGRYMPEYMAVRKHHSLLDICRTPDIAAEVTITAAERLGVDAAIIFADLLLPLTPLGLDFDFIAGEGPVVRTPLRTYEQVQALRIDRTAELQYVSRAIEKVAKHFDGKGSGPRVQGSEDPTPQDQLGIIGFIGAPFTLASYMIEGGSSRNYIHAKQMMYASNPSPLSSPAISSSAKVGSTDPRAWPLLMEKLVTVLTDYAQQQVDAGADVIQIFDSWAGALSVDDFREFCFEPTRELIARVRNMGVPVIYFGVDTASLLPTFRELQPDVIGLDWRVPLAEGWRAVGPGIAVQGNLDPITLFAPEAVIEARVKEILRQAAGRPGHIFNLGHGIVPETPVEAVINVARWVKQHGITHSTPKAPTEPQSEWAVRA